MRSSECLRYALRIWGQPTRSSDIMEYLAERGRSRSPHGATLPRPAIVVRPPADASVRAMSTARLASRLALVGASALAPACGALVVGGSSDDGQPASDAAPDLA